MTAFPGSEASFTGFTSSHTLAADSHASQHNLEQSEITATQHKIGTGSSTPTSGTLLRGIGVGTSSWAQAVLTSDVSGVLPQANGGTGTTLATGSGKAVYDTSPTISSPTVSGGTFSSPTLTTPTIASFTNAIHNHENNVGGGTLNAANALQAGSVSFANLLSTIFSSQVTTQANAGSAGGNFSYINLGGLKLLWGNTAVISVAGSGFQSTSAAITFPASFFSTIKATVATAADMTNTQFMWTSWVSTPSTTSGSVYLNQGTGSNGTATAHYLVIGT